MAEPRPLEQRIADTRAHLENDEDAWVATAGDQPYLVPLSFIWHSGELLFATIADSPTCRNVGATPTVRIAVGPTRDLVLVDGDARVVPIAEMRTDEVSAYKNKCGSDPNGWADALIRVRLTRVQAWREENELRGRTIMRDGRWLDGA